MRKGLSIIAGIAVLLFAYSASAGVEMDGLVSWWKFDETSGTNAADYQGNNPGILLEDYVWTDDVAGSASSGALYFHGVGSGVDCDSGVNITNTVTMEVWVRPTVDGTWNWFITRDSNWRMALSDAPNGNQFFVEGTDADGTHIMTPYLSAAEYDGVWCHLVGILEPGEARIYINGDLKGTKEDADYAGPPSSSASTLIGGGFTGTMDDVRVYSKALTQAQITGNYNAIPEPSTLLLLGAGLLGLLAFRRIKAKS